MKRGNCFLTSSPARPGRTPTAGAVPQNSTSLSLARNPELHAEACWKRSSLRVLTVFPSAPSALRLERDELRLTLNRPRTQIPAAEHARNRGDLLYALDLAVDLRTGCPTPNPATKPVMGKDAAEHFELGTVRWGLLVATLARLLHILIFSDESAGRSRGFARYTAGRCIE